MKLVIVGGVAGGASAAARARRLDEHAEIVVLERGPDLSFANCGLPYYLGGEIQQRSKLLVTPLERLKVRYKLDARPHSEVTRIDRAGKRVMVRDRAAGREYFETYDKLILSPGAKPRVPDVPGGDLPGVFTLRTLEDTDRIFARLKDVRHAVLMGGGFISLEVAENLAHRGIGVTVVERNAQLLMPFDPEMTTPLVKALRAKGVELILGGKVARILPGAGGTLQAQLADGRVLDADLILAGIGVEPESHLAGEAGLELGVRGAIRVNRHMQTSDPDIYAAGDVVEIQDIVTGLGGVVPLGGPANRQGRIAADHIFGRATSYRGTQGTAIVRLFDLTAACTGASEKTLKRCNIPHRAAYLHPANHAGYYPGARQMSLKVLFAPNDGRVLGAQAVGGDGVDKRIDVLAMAIQGRMTVYDLEEAELCYAPPYGSAKDPVNMAGFICSGILRGDQPQVTVGELVRQQQSGAIQAVVDVRGADEFARGHLPGAINIPVDELRGRLGDVPPGRIAVNCQVGMRGYLATRILLAAGRDVVNLSGGYLAWELFEGAGLLG
jgi:NADPH-dependent 2,4-dienoyl-CoA reductase/sulfur reductase-like enzyme/rhodanese-related sulfurtransferase